MLGLLRFCSAQSYNSILLNETGMAGLLTVLRVNSLMRVQKMPKAKNRLVQFTTLPQKVKRGSDMRLRRYRLLRSHLEFGLAVTIVPSPMTCRYVMYLR